MSNFKEEFLDNYLQFGLGSMPKSDIDALVMHLIDKYGANHVSAQAIYPNQQVSQNLKTPVSKIKTLRYNAALKFGAKVEDEAQARLLIALSNATLDSEGEIICMIIEDSLAKNWLQGQLKNNQLIFDHSFNTEIIKVSSDGLFKVLKSFFDVQEIENFEKKYNEARDSEDKEKLKDTFKELAKSFAKGIAKKAGETVFSIFKAKLTGTP